MQRVIASVLGRLERQTSKLSGDAADMFGALVKNRYNMSGILGDVEPSVQGDEIEFGDKALVVKEGSGLLIKHSESSDELMDFVQKVLGDEFDVKETDIDDESFDKGITISP